MGNVIDSLMPLCDDGQISNRVMRILDFYYLAKLSFGQIMYFHIQATMISLSTKFEMSVFTQSEDRKVMQSLPIGLV